MKYALTLLIVAISFCIIFPHSALAQKSRSKKAKPAVKKTVLKKRTAAKKPRPAKTRPARQSGPRTWTLMNQAGTDIHQKLRFTPGPCQKLESWTYIFGGAEKLTVQAGTPGSLDCPSFAHWESAPLSSLKLPGFEPAEQMEFADENLRKPRKLTLHEGWIQIGGLIGNQIKRHPSGLYKIIDDFLFNVLYPLMLNEQKALAALAPRLFLYSIKLGYVVLAARTTDEALPRP